MKQLLIHINEELDKELRRLVKEKYGGRKGALSLLAEEAFQTLVEPEREISVATLLNVIDYIAEATKQGLSRDQILTNVFLILDQEFEQSIMQGIADKKSGRLYRVPEKVDPIEFLQALASKAD